MQICQISSKVPIVTYILRVCTSISCEPILSICRQMTLMNWIILMNELKRLPDTFTTALQNVTGDVLSFKFIKIFPLADFTVTFRSTW